MQNGFQLLICLCLNVTFVFGSCWAQSTRQVAETVDLSIVDSQDDSVDDVEVYWFGGQLAKRLSPKDGQIADVPNHGLVVAHKEGFQYCGLLLGTERRSLVMRKLDEPGGKLQTQPIPFSKTQRTQLLKLVQKRVWESIESQPDDTRLLSMYLPIAAAIDPDKATKFVVDRQLPPPLVGMTKQALIASYVDNDFEKAIELIESEEQPEFKSMLLKRLADQLSDEDPRNRTVENELVRAVNSVQNPAYRLAALASHGASLVESGRIAEANQLVEQYLPEVEKLPSGGWSGFPRSLFAALIVEEQPERALALIDGINDQNERLRSRCRLAFHACVSNPQLAETLLFESKVPANSVAGYNQFARVAARMATAHPQKAIDLVERIPEPNQRAWGLGLISKRLADDDPDRAKDLLKRATETLANVTAAEQFDSYLSTAETLGGLLPVGEQVCPEQLESMAWQTVWLTIPRSRWVKSKSIRHESRRHAAAALERFWPGISNDLIVNGVDPTASDAAAVQLVFDAKVLENWLDDDQHLQLMKQHRDIERLVQLLSHEKEAFWGFVSQPKYLQPEGQRFEDFD
ncbi:MAG: hypothetical protein AAFN77_22060 [Planctomycetota bacterium]